jgi:hypothetical protein
LITIFDFDVPGGIGIGHGFLHGIVVAYGNNRTGAHPSPARCGARSARHTGTSLPQAQLFDLPSPTGMKRARRMAKGQVGDLGACVGSSTRDRAVWTAQPASPRVVGDTD